MITFYPRDIGMWRKDFDFHPDITLTPKEKTDHKVFRNRQEFIQFLGEHDVKLNDPKNPLLLEKWQLIGSAMGQGTPAQGELFSVVQWTVLGWFRDDYK